MYIGICVTRAGVQAYCNIIQPVNRGLNFIWGIIVTPFIHEVVTVVTFSPHIFYGINKHGTLKHVEKVYDVTKLTAVNVLALLLPSRNILVCLHYSDVHCIKHVRISIFIASTINLYVTLTIYHLFNILNTKVMRKGLSVPLIFCMLTFYKEFKGKNHSTTNIR